MSTHLQSPYLILDVSENASIKQIEAAYEKLETEFANSNKNSNDVYFMNIVQTAFDKIMQIKADDTEPPDLEENYEKMTDNVAEQVCNKLNVNSNANQLEPELFESKCPSIVHNLFLTLEEILNGCTKVIKIVRQVETSDSELVEEEKSFTLKIKPGQYSIVFENEGNQKVNSKQQGDVVFNIKDKPHALFKRINEFDLEYVANVMVKPDCQLYEIKVPTLEYDPIIITLESDDIEENLVEKFSNRGLPKENDRKSRGDFVVRFNFTTENTASNQQNDDSKDSQEIPVNKYDLYLTLEEIFNGCFKDATIERKRFDKNGNERLENAQMSIEIKPGIFTNSFILMLQEGDQLSDGTFLDAQFIVREIEHSTFKRNGTNLSCIAKISQNQLVNCEKILVPTIDGKMQNIQLNDEIANKLEKRFIGRGLPYPGEPKMKGSLTVQFEIVSEAEAKEFAELVSSKERQFQMERLQQNLPSNKPIIEKESLKSPHIEHELFLSLNQILNGIVKKVKVKRNVINLFGQSEVQEKLLKIDIKPGTEAGTRFTFLGEGDQEIGKASADIVFILRDKVDGVFKRNGADIEYVVKMSQSELLKTNGKFDIPTLENDVKQVEITEFTSKSMTKRIPHCGLPYPDGSGKRGDIVVRFEVVNDKTKGSDIRRDMPLTLLNILHGCSKRLKINRRIIDDNGVERFEDKILRVDIIPGTIDGTECRFLNCGDESPDTIAADVIFVARDKPHVDFQRFGDDLIHTVLVTISEVQHGVELKIPTLENDKTITFSTTNINKQFMSKQYPGLGLPKAIDPSQHGNLIVKFEVVSDDRKDPTVESQLLVSIEDILNGCTKKRKINRSVVDLNGSQSSEAKIVKINIPPGTEDGTKFNFPRHSDRQQGRISADITFVMASKQHQIFKRNGANIEFVATITESEAQNGGQVMIPTLENDHELLQFNCVMKDEIRIIAGKGLPFSFNPQMRGDIWVRFNIVPDNDNNKNNINSMPIQTEIINNFSENSSLPEQEHLYPKIDDNLIQPTVQEPDNLNVANLQQNPNQQMFTELEVDPIYIKLELSLEEIYFGCIGKEVPFQRDIIYPNGSKFCEMTSIKLDISAGAETGKKFVFAKQGHQRCQSTQSDVIVYLAEKPHNLFKRNGADIEYTARIYSRQIAQGSNIIIPTIENNEMAMALNRAVQNNSVIPISGMGLPYPNDNSRRGKLMVRFEIVDL